MSYAIILASSSVNRQELLSRLRLPFMVCIPDIDETAIVGETPVTTAKRLASIKGLKVSKEVMVKPEFEPCRQKKQIIVIASDQVAFANDASQTQTIFDKPITRARAITQLMQMQGRRIGFMTALSVFAINTKTGAIEKSHEGGVMTYARFRALSAAQIERYVDIDQPLHCAGAAKCESLGIALLSQVKSTDPTALIGLPLILLTDFFEKLGINVL